MRAALRLPLTPLRPLLLLALLLPPSNARTQDTEAAYVPADFSAPAERNQSILRDADVRAAFLDNWTEAGAWEFDDVVAQPARQDADVPVQVLRASTTIGWTDTAALRAMPALTASTARPASTTSASWLAPAPRWARP